MAQIANIVLTDRAATPVAHTFTPRDVTGGVGVCVESTGVPIGDRRFSISLKENGVGNFKGEIRLVVPVVATQTINGVQTPTVVRTNQASVTFTFAPDSNEQERKDIIGMLYSSLAPGATLVNDTLTKPSGVY